MAKAPRERRRNSQSAGDHPASHTQPEMVASLGLQARLVPAGPEREYELACLLVRFERVCRDWERLVQQAIALLGPELQPNRTVDRTTARSCDD
jgi:hypothetical protein